MDHAEMDKEENPKTGLQEDGDYYYGDSAHKYYRSDYEFMFIDFFDDMSTQV